MDNLILTGMPGSGKSTVGVLLAKALGMDFLDSDLLIQKRTGELLSETIAREGIDGFLEIEEDVNASLMCTNSVIATGGSAVFGKRAMDHFRSIGRVVYLEVPVGELASRLGDLDERGVVHQPGQTLKDILEERTPLYKRYADLTVREPETGFDPSAILGRILDALAEEK